MGGDALKRIEAWGTELALALRREADAQLAATLAAARADEASQEVQELQKRIVSASNEETWMSTAEWEALPDRSETAQFTMHDRPCPGEGYCAWHGRRHMHALDGRIYDVSYGHEAS